MQQHLSSTPISWDFVSPDWSCNHMSELQDAAAQADVATSPTDAYLLGCSPASKQLWLYTQRSPSGHGRLCIQHNTELT